MRRLVAVNRPRGFSLVELLVAMAVALLITSALFAMLDPASGAFQVHPEESDVQQRLRVAADAVMSDVTSSGGGPWLRPAADRADQAAAPVFPLRVGRRSPDPAGTFSSHRLTLWSVRAAAPQAVLAAPFASTSGAAVITLGAGCVAGDASCGFRPGTIVGLFGPSGAWDLFSVTGVQGTLLTLQHNLRDGPGVYPAGETSVAEITVRTYFFRDDSTTGVPQLMRYDAAGGGDIPVVDHVAAFDVEYFGDAEPPRLLAATADEPDRVTYGPSPPAREVQRSQYPPGENCVFTRSAGGVVSSRLASLDAAPVLVPMAAAMLTDGPWCPDAADPNRYDADLLRIRRVGVTITIESAIAALRGPAGPLFTRAGTARGTRLVPDRTVRLAVALRGLSVNR